MVEEMVEPSRKSTWKLTLAYDGAAYFGWQVQPELPTVQGALSSALFRVCGEAVLPQGSGRTDAGVHALAQVASVDLAAAIPPASLKRALNHALPPDIRVLAAEKMAEGFHARHSARRKTYEYRIFERRLDEDTDRVCPPFLARYTWDCRWRLDLDRMRCAAADLVGEKDWTSFAAVDPDLTGRTQTVEPKSAVKTVFAVQLARESRHGCDLLVVRVTGSGFLHHMVRNIVGTLVEIGRGAIAENAVPEILAARSRSSAGPTAPAGGLYLVGVDYGEVPA